MLIIENLSVSYGNIRALHGIDLVINEGEIVTIIGANGAGKSTTLRAISGLVPISADSRLTFQGENLSRFPADKVVSKLGISHV
ncbi:MAG: ATP-binding cassette domain-containing protein, partial [Desulfobacterales bacterium]